MFTRTETRPAAGGAAARAAVLRAACLLAALWTLPAAAGVLQFVLAYSQLDGDVADLDTDEVFALSSAGIGRDILAQAGVVGAQAAAAASTFGSVGLSAFVAQSSFEAGSRVEISSDEFVNVTGAPRYATVNFIIDGGVLFMPGGGRGVSAGYALDLRARNLGPVAALPDPGAHRFASAIPLFSTEGVLEADDAGRLSFEADGADLGAIFDASTGRVEIPLSLHSVDIGVMAPGDRMFLEYRLTIDVGDPTGGHEGVVARFSDPFSLSANGVLQSVVLSPVPEPSTLALFAAAAAAAVAARSRRRAAIVAAPLLAVAGLCHAQPLLQSHLYFQLTAKPIVDQVRDGFVDGADTARIELADGAAWTASVRARTGVDSARSFASAAAEHSSSGVVDPSGVASRVGGVAVSRAELFYDVHVLQTATTPVPLGEVPLRAAVFASVYREITLGSPAWVAATAFARASVQGVGDPIDLDLRLPAHGTRATAERDYRFTATPGERIRFSLSAGASATNSGRPRDDDPLGSSSTAAALVDPTIAFDQLALDELARAGGFASFDLASHYAFEVHPLLAVPEPVPWALIAIGGATLLIRFCRARQKVPGTPPRAAC